MDQELTTSHIPFLRAQKGFEGTSAFYCWGVTARINGRHEKCWLIADAEQKTCGVRLIAEKPENLNPSGAVVAQMRKHARAPTIGRILKANDTGDIWIELYTESSEQPSFYVHIAQGSPPELRLIGKDKTIHVRKSSQGSFTKKRPFEGDFPSTDSNAMPGFTVLNSDLIASLFSQNETPLDDETDDTAQSEESTIILPDYQREARDRIARRLKTLRKTLAKSKTPEQIAQEQSLAQKRAELAQAWIHTIKEGAHEVDLSFLPDIPSELQRIPLDPDASVGANLESLFTTAKKLKKAAQVTEKMHAATVRDEQALADDLFRLRSRPLDMRAVQDILQRHKLAEKKPASNNKEDAQEHTPWRTFTYFDGTKPIRFMIGKSAADNDELCKKAKGNDIWLHAVGVTGSHVIIPARAVGATPPQELIRIAGILALHFSKFRDDLRGEVYLSKRHFIRKQKGMPPGLWTVDKADSFFISYDATELQKALDLQKSPGAKAP